MSDFLNKLKRIQAIADIGIKYAENGYDVERYEELSETAFQLIHAVVEQPIGSLKHKIQETEGYPTPKTDVRALVTNKNNEILLCQEKTDLKWSLPGGFADVSYSPKEIAVKETHEETGIEVKPNRLLAIFFNERHNPPDLWSIYKYFIQCDYLGGTPKPGVETLDARFFNIKDLPPLSEKRNTLAQVKKAFDLKNAASYEVFCD